ncbi:MAG: hypothetical protein KIG70_09865 [Treponema sp.]|uniref:hypothetical protein n=1 Tax=Treponema sp. TaxID=166 RepID=UPI001DB78EDE|nr:hypothetical protein [Treponema sp.]MBS7311472.1 hypothetical protein [Treponema sp.]MCI5697386.1 hypothetical protein [Spirochaetia bacterium]MDD5811757.1 hypothetical protein [Treponema sp.]MDY5885371.1 hypothetical protein [Treponema sp.]
MAKKLMLDLPLKLILTEAGASNFISHKKNLKKIKLADNVEEYGVSLNKFSPQSVQNMLLLEYISKIEISMSEFVSKRQEVMDLSKLIVYSVLYKQFDREIFQAFIASDCVRRHNRQNPAQLIDEKTNMGEMKLRQILSTKNGLIEQTRKAILAPIWKAIISNKDYSPEEKNVYLLTSEKFMNRLGLMNWYIITKFSKDENFSEMISSVRSLLTKYMDKSKVAEYISVMVMELALNNENANIRKEAQQMYADRDDISTLVLDPDVRKKIVRELESKHEQVFLSWKIGGGSSSVGKQGRLHITLYNKDDEFQEVKENFEMKAQADTAKRSLVDFYRELPEGQEGTDLGMYYLSYLDDACKKVNVKFESLVNQFTASGLTVINLIFNFQNNG